MRNESGENNVSDAAEPTYQFRARLIGETNSYRLMPEALAWTVGRKSGELLYRDVKAMRLGLRPTNFMSNRFIAEIFARDGLKLAIGSLSMKGIFDSENQGPAYRSFIREFASRVNKAAPDCRFDAGMPIWRWWPAAVFTGLTLALLLYILLRALLRGENSLAIILALFAILFVWQVGGMLRRNRPRICDGSALPKEILP